MTITGRLHLVLIPCADADRSIAFYAALGFRSRADFPMGDDGRWVELFPPDGTAGIALAPGGAVAAEGVDTGILLTTQDIDAAVGQLRGRGVDVDAEVARPGGDVAVVLGSTRVVGPTPPMVGFRDPDGNRLRLVQPG